MLPTIRKFIFSNKEKTSTAAQMFLFLCIYAILTTIYGYYVVGIWEMLFRLLIGLLMVICHVVCERSRINSNIAAFFLPSFIITAVYIGAIYSGDVLVYLYIIAGAMISLTYFKPKSLLFYIIYNVILGTIILVVGEGNLLGGEYSFVHNLIFFVVSNTLSLVIFVICLSYANTIECLKEAEAKAAMAAKAKGNFLARMSHEIRTPLNAIIGLTEMQIRKKLSDDQRAALTKIQSSGTLLLGIINDILDLSKIESGKFDLILEEYALADILNDIINLNAIRIGEKPIRFIIDVDPDIPMCLIGDSLRIKQLLSNLLSNAFKYTNEGKVIFKVDWELLNGKAKLIFTISDTGMGMHEDDLIKLFSEYSQVNQHANKTIEGTGLGLSICKWLVELMNGSITAASEFGKGSSFTASILQDIANPTPLGEKKAKKLSNFSYVPEEKEVVLECIPFPNAHILIVDDVEINLLVAESLMEPYQMQIECVSSGKEAIEAVKKKKYDLIFMDHMMPEMDGIEATWNIRRINDSYALTIPIIALSANAIAGSEKMFIDNGFQDFLAKPIDTQKLDAILHKWLAVKKN